MTPITTITATTRTVTIDEVTLADLELFGTRPGAPGVFGLVDRTETTIGRRALRRRLSRPLADAAAIRDVQRALRDLRAAPGAVRIDDRALSRTRTYLGSNIQVERRSGLGARVATGWIRIRYADQLRELREGQDALRVTLGDVERVCAALRTDAGLLSRIVGRLAEIAGRLRGAYASGGILEVDRRLRADLADEVAEALELLGELDALNAMAVAGDRAGWTTPEVVDAPAFLLEAEDAVHPFVEDPVPNPVHLRGAQPLVFLTGPNMAGKTTYLRTVGLLLLLAQTGMNVPARTMRFAPVEAILTSLGPVDNLRAGVSYFLAEVLRVRDAARLLAEGRRSLILFDEVFKGTNVRDALDASRRVIDGFARSECGASIFSSHLTDLAAAFGDHPGIRLERFDGEVTEGAPRFSYALEPGVSDTRMGLVLLDRAGVPELLREIGA